MNEIHVKARIHVCVCACGSVRAHVCVCRVGVNDRNRCLPSCIVGLV